MDGGSKHLRPALAAMAAAGIAAAHHIAYVFAAPAHHGHEGRLAGIHGYWPYFVAAVVGATVAGLVSSGAGRVRQGPGAAPSLARMTGCLAGVQVCGFLILEAGERMLFLPGETLAVEPVMVAGLAAQLVVAACGGLLLRAFLRVVDLVAALVRRLPEGGATAVPRLLSQTTPARPAPVAAGFSLRGPPGCG